MDFKEENALSINENYENAGRSSVKLFGTFDESCDNTSNKNLKKVHSFKIEYFKTKILFYLIIMHSIVFIALFNTLSHLIKG